MGPCGRDSPLQVWATSQTAAAGIRARRARTRSTQRARAPGEALVALLQLLGLLLLLRLLWPLCSHPVGVASHSFASQLLAAPSQKPPASDNTQRVSFSECAKQQVAFWQSPPAPWSRYGATTTECGSCGVSLAQTRQGAVAESSLVLRRVIGDLAFGVGEDASLTQMAPGRARRRLGSKFLPSLRAARCSPSLALVGLGDPLAGKPRSRRREKERDGGEETHGHKEKV